MEIIKKFKQFCYKARPKEYEKFQLGDRYQELLQKYSNDTDLLELINLCIIDNRRERELFYLRNNKYPEKRELIEKLRIDLLTLKEV